MRVDRLARIFDPCDTTGSPEGILKSFEVVDRASELWGRSGNAPTYKFYPTKGTLHVSSEGRTHAPS